MPHAKVRQIEQRGRALVIAEIAKVIFAITVRPQREKSKVTLSIRSVMFDAPTE